MKKDCKSCLHGETDELCCNECCLETGKPPTKWESAPHYTPDTNADRIRAMSDEELAKVFTDTVASGCPPKMDWDCAKDKNGWDACDACWCKWLKQPAEEDF